MSFVIEGDNDVDVVALTVGDVLNSSVTDTDTVEERLALSSSESLGDELRVEVSVFADSDRSSLAVRDDDTSFESVNDGISESVSDGSLDPVMLNDDSLLSVVLGSWDGEVVFEGDRLPTVRLVRDLVVLTKEEGDVDGVCSRVGVSDDSADIDIVVVGGLLDLDSDGSSLREIVFLVGVGLMVLVACVWLVVDVGVGVAISVLDALRRSVLVRELLVSLEAETEPVIDSTSESVVDGVNARVMVSVCTTVFVGDIRRE